MNKQTTKTGNRNRLRKYRKQTGGCQRRQGWGTSEIVKGIKRYKLPRKKGKKKQQPQSSALSL